MFNCLIFTIMKRSLFMLGATVAMLSSCTQNEIINVNESRAIGFDSFVGKPTRAAVTTENLTSFNVFGGFDAQYDNVYKDVVVTKTDEGAGNYAWLPAQTKYWQLDKTYNFCAYSPSGNGTESADANGIVITGFNASSGDVDLIVAKAGPIAADATFIANPQSVQFTFNHVLSMIRFTFATTLEDVTISITDLKVNNVPCKATYTNSIWQTPVAETKSTYGLTVANNITKDASQNSSEAIVIPQTFGADALNVTFKLTATGALSITGKDGSGVQHSVKLPATTWENGKRYNYKATFDITNIDPENPDNYEPIEFGAPTVTLWETNNDWIDSEIPDYGTTMP